ncbi:MAG: autotransporter outer membrane beta-barrel domain-containing protein [Phascolarctobacterium sp.]|uniref:autotransporter outer membrane beta-barrel domain-containing protein n=1 Tax=Phascolarctobacterium sp. TaxID=2049039 RepID=UPI0026DC1294|nr:autotransporter outer membrane beta-barrel domain-containing protein [Phascolarctobacterium sp.]MDO4922145.1 autotransporter outer membrane beta-barrel domain-containing protein [Phascolarctobacterium sp.]
MKRKEILARAITLGLLLAVPCGAWAAEYNDRISGATDNYGNDVKTVDGTKYTYDFGGDAVLKMVDARNTGIFISSTDQVTNSIIIKNKLDIDISYGKGDTGYGIFIGLNHNNALIDRSKGGDISLKVNNESSKNSYGATATGILIEANDKDRLLFGSGNISIDVTDCMQNKSITASGAGIEIRGSNTEVSGENLGIDIKVKGAVGNESASVIARGIFDTAQGENNKVNFDSVNIKVSGESDGTVFSYGISVEGKESIINIANGGKIEAEAKSTKSGNSYGIIASAGTVNLGDGSAITAKNTSAEGLNIGIVASGGTVNVGNNSTITAIAEGDVDVYSVYAYNSSKVNLGVTKIEATNASVGSEAMGIYAVSNSVVNLAGGSISGQTGVGEEFVAIESRGAGTQVNVNEDGKNEIAITGTVSALNEGVINVNLTTADSSITGVIDDNSGDSSVDKSGKITLNLSDGATWKVTDDSYATTVNLDNGGNINLSQGNADSNYVARIGALSSKGGVINTDNLTNKIKVDDPTGIESLTVHGTSAITDLIAQNEKVNAQRLADVVINSDDSLEYPSVATQITTDASSVAGAYTADVVDGKVVFAEEQPNVPNQGISEMAAISLMTWRQENDDMNKRLGELRDSVGEHGVWVRMTRGEAKYGNQNIKNQYNAYQLGYDEKLSVDKRWTVGAALTYTDAESSFSYGKGENKHKGLAVYGSRLNDDGSFIDLIARYARLEHDYEVYGGAGKGDFDTNGYSLSAEYGKRFTQKSGLWIEPQVELTYGRVSSGEYLTNNGVRVRQEGMDSVVGRLGFALGKNLAQGKGNVYLRASYLYDFDGETDVRYSYGIQNKRFEQDLGGGWWEVGVGTNINLSEASHLYFDVEKTYGGDVATPWQWNAGVRWSF